jgi:hypothetical protein
MQVVSENVPIWASQKFNKLASFDLVEIAMEEKNGAFLYSESGIPV